MAKYNKHFYHPFQNTSLGFSLHVESSEDSFSGFIINDIKLFYQPVEEPNIAIIFFIIRSITMCLAEFINYKLLKKMKKNTGLQNDVTKLQSYTIMIVSPFSLLFITANDFIHPLNTIVGQWFCTFGWFFLYVCIYIISFHSFGVAWLRYFFIVHTKKATKFGKKKIKKIFLYLNIFIPILTMLWVASDVGEIDLNRAINRCNGKDHKMFLIQTSSLGIVGQNFKGLQISKINETSGKVLAILRRASKIARRLWTLFLGSNITECIVYYKVISYMYK